MSIEQLMPRLATEPGPGVNSFSRRELAFGIDLLDTLSGGSGGPTEQGHMKVDRIEVQEFDLIAD